MSVSQKEIKKKKKKGGVVLLVTAQLYSVQLYSNCRAG